MTEIIQTIAERIMRLAQGFAHDVKPVDEGISELRVHLGPGYRIYLCNRETLWWFFSVAEIKAHKNETYRLQSDLLNNGGKSND